MALPIPPAFLLLPSAPAAWFRWCAAGLTMTPLDQEIPWLSIAPVKFLGRKRRASGDCSRMAETPPLAKAEIAVRGCQRRGLYFPSATGPNFRGAHGPYYQRE